MCVNKDCRVERARVIKRHPGDPALNAEAWTREAREGDWHLGYARCVRVGAVAPIEVLSGSVDGRYVRRLS